MQHFADYVPAKLYDFVTWLVDEKKYNNVSDSFCGRSKENNLGVIVLSHNISIQKVSECCMFYAIPTARVIYTAKTSLDVSVWGDRIYEMKCLFVAVGLHALFIELG